MRRSFIVTFALLLAVGAGVAALRNGWIVIPPEWSPWATLDLEAPPNFLTRHKLSRLTGDDALCRQVLQSAAMEFEPVPDRVTGEGCGFRNAVLVRRTSADVGEDFSVSCRTAVSLAMWERHALQPAAEKYFGQRVSAIRHFGSYSCRNVYGRPEATRSRHATAEAWDVAAFVLADGRQIRVERGWQTTGAEAAFLRASRDGACRFFDGVLSPDYNAAHRDHLHFDRGPYRVCR